MDNFSNRQNLTRSAVFPGAAARQQLFRPSIPKDQLAGIIPEGSIPCSIHISGTHYFADRYIFSNIYGESFFPGEAGFIRQNPYVSDSGIRGSSIIDEFFDSELQTVSESGIGITETQKKIMTCVDPQFLQKDSKKHTGQSTLDFNSTGLIYEDENRNLVISYGSFLPDEVKITVSGADVVSFTTMGSLFETLPLHSGKTTHRVLSLVPGDFIKTLESTLGDAFDEFLSDGGLELDCLITSKITKNTLTKDGGVLEADYTVVTGVRKIEQTHFRAEVVPQKPKDFTRKD